MARFWSDRDGNFLIMTAFATAILFLSAGMAVEYSLALMHKTRLQNALDAAALATARALSLREITESAAPDYLEDVFIANVGVTDMAASRYSLHNITVDPASGAVSASARYRQDLKLVRVATSRSELNVSNQTRVQYGASDVEVAMVLDVTGSMDWDDAAGNHKITALKTAAKSAVEELLRNTNGSVRISLVPYAETVNVGSSLAKYVYADYKEPKSDAPAYNGNLYSSTGVGYDYAAFQQQYHQQRCRWKRKRVNGKKRRVKVCTNRLPNDFRVNNDGTNVDTCATDRKAPKSSGRTSYQYTDANPVTGGMISRDSRLHPDDCISEEIVPLTTSKTVLDRAINGLGTNGGTAGHIGLQWAWYTISYKWRNHLPVASQPGDQVTNADLDKYIIFMTDGVFNTAYAGNSGNSGWTGHNPGNSRSPSHTSTLCTSIKNEDIKVFVVAFDMDESSADGNRHLRRSWIRNAQTLLRNCATPDTARVKYFYKADDANALALAFDNIANTIRSLRLTQ